jgi:hypothetical protein
MGTTRSAKIYLRVLRLLFLIAVVTAVVALGLDTWLQITICALVGLYNGWAGADIMYSLNNPPIKSEWADH